MTGMIDQPDLPNPLHYIISFSPAQGIFILILKFLLCNGLWKEEKIK